MTRAEALSAVLGALREIEDYDTDFTAGVDENMGRLRAIARAALASWESAGPLGDDDDAWQAVFSACCSVAREDNPVPAFDAAVNICDAIDTHLFGAAPTKETGR